MQSGEISLLIDPGSNRLKADVVLKTALVPESDASAMDLSPETISFPGEYEVKGIEIEGYGLPTDSSSKLLKTIYAVTWEDIRFVIMGQASELPEMKVLERIGDPDVLIIPVSADHFFDPESAAKIVKQIEPKVAIPNFSEEKDLKDLRKAMGQDASAEDKFVFKKKDLPLDHARLVVLKSK